MRSSKSTQTSSVFAILAASVICLAAISRGEALGVPHLALSKSEPKADSTVAMAPKELKLWFSEPVHTAMTAVRLSASDSSLVALATATQSKTAGSPVVLTVKGAMKPGVYTVSWKAMGDDGHAVDGKFKFTLKM